ncbi:MAG: hypothetical protein IT238_07010 [Bacteroidia bacterium]|nr:hypothetical protein [Bacteroidia bacterium]
MKTVNKITKTVLALFMSSQVVVAQNEDDALRFSNTSIGGTARSISMAGAFGALGADFSSLTTNPGGIGLYRASEFTFSPALKAASTKSSYLGQSNSDDHYQFNISNTGIIFANPIESANSKWKGVAMGFGYNRLANFNNRVVMEGNNQSSSLTDVYLHEAQSYNPENLPLFGPDLAWSTYLIDTLSNKYYSAMPSNIDKIQRKTIERRGGIGETVLTVGGNYDNKLFIGGTIGFEKIRYWEESRYSERPATDTFDIKSFYIDNYLNTDGNGINFKAGFVYMPIPAIRIGGAIHSPTFYSLTDSYSAGMSTSFSDGKTYSAGIDAAGGGDKGSFNYRYISPFRAIGSLAFVIGEYGLISADYEYVDYRNSRFRAQGYNFSDQNNAIRDKFKSVGNIRMGAEVRLTPFSLRFGYGIYPSAFKNAGLMSNQQLITGGVGYRQDGFFADIAYMRSFYNEKYYLYNSAFNPNPSQNSISSGMVVLTLGKRF